MSDISTEQARWDELIEQEAQSIADRENSCSGCCGSYGDETADDYRASVRVQFEAIGRAYMALTTRLAPDRDELASYEKFDGIGPHAETIETRARIGERYLEAYESALSDPRLKGYSPADCPSELLLDLINGDALTPATAPDREAIARVIQKLRRQGDHEAADAILSLMGEG